MTSRHSGEVSFLLGVQAKLSTLTNYTSNPHSVLTRQHPHTLSYDKACQLDRLIQEQWARFMSCSPAHWRRDGWLASREPFSAVYKYGQNQRIIWEEETLEGEATNWDSDHDYSRIDHLNFALASHIE